jgi:hypothetical protein
MSACLSQSSINPEESVSLLGDAAGGWRRFDQQANCRSVQAVVQIISV